MIDVLEEPMDVRDGISGLPDSLFVIDMGSGKFAAVNATVPDPVKPLTCGFLAVFADEQDIETFKHQYLGLSYGKVVPKSLKEALDIAASKAPTLRGLALQRGGTTVHPLRFTA